MTYGDDAERPGLEAELQFVGTWRSGEAGRPGDRPARGEIVERPLAVGGGPPGRQRQHDLATRPPAAEVRHQDGELAGGPRVDRGQHGADRRHEHPSYAGGDEEREHASGRHRERADRRPQQSMTRDDVPPAGQPDVLLGVRVHRAEEAYGDVRGAAGDQVGRGAGRGDVPDAVGVGGDGVRRDDAELALQGDPDERRFA
jgi:hypothetical protein